MPFVSKNQHNILPSYQTFFNQIIDRYENSELRNGLIKDEKQIIDGLSSLDFAIENAILSHEYIKSKNKCDYCPQ